MADTTRTETAAALEQDKGVDASLQDGHVKSTASEAVLVNGEPIPYETVPVSYMAGGMRRYFESGISPGSFGLALLCNDLRGAAARADDENSRCLMEWVQWLHMHAPSGSWGSREAVNAWLTERQAARAKGAA